MSTDAARTQDRNRLRPPTVLYDAGGRITTFVYSRPAEPEPAQPPVQLQHDRKNHRLKITTPDGRTAQFADRPVRFLVMARNPKTKALQPVLVRGEPLYYYLSPEVAAE